MDHRGWILKLIFHQCVGTQRAKVMFAAFAFSNVFTDWLLSYIRSFKPQPKYQNKNSYRDKWLEMVWTETNADNFPYLCTLV